MALINRMMESSPLVTYQPTFYLNSKFQEYHVSIQGV